MRKVFSSNFVTGERGKGLGGIGVNWEREERGKETQFPYCCGSSKKM